MRVLQVKNVAYIGEALVSGLNQFGVEAELYETFKFTKKRLPRLIKIFLGLFIAVYELFRFYFFLRKTKYDIIHIHYGAYAYLTLFTRIPYYLHLHGTDLREAIQRPITGWFVRQGIKHAIKVFYTTPDLKRIVKHLRSDAIFFPNPVNMELFHPYSNQLNNNIIDVFSISKIDKYKGIEIIFDTIRNLTEQDPKIKIQMFGFGRIFAEVSETIAQLKNSSQIKLLDRVNHNEMVNLINNSKIILGQMGTGILTCSELESMACGKPVVCRFSYAEAYPSPPPIIAVDTADEAKEKILELLDSPETAAALGRQARRWIAENYDIKPVAKKLLDIYQGGGQ